MKYLAVICITILASSIAIDDIVAQRDTTTQVVDVTNLATGRIWMDRNLGASRAATSSTDTQAYGDLYQWGRRADGHQKRNSATISTLSSTDGPSHGSFIQSSNSPNDWRSPQNDNLWQGVNGVNNPCPVGYRIPTIAEWEAERQSWGSNNASGAINSPLKLPMAGRRDYSNGLLYNLGSISYYWSSSVNSLRAQYLFSDSTNAFVDFFDRAFGYSVRCLKDAETTSIETGEYPLEFSLHQNYPNPFNPTTQIRFALPESQVVSISVYDVNGRLISNLIDNARYSAGHHQVTFDGSGLSSGIYIYTLTTSDGLSMTRKLLLVK